MKKERLKFNSINEIDYSGLNKLNTSLYGNYPDLKSELKLKTTYAPNQDLGIIVKNKELIKLVDKIIDKIMDVNINVK